MTFADACLASLIRALLAALIVVLLSRWQSEFLRQRSGRSRNLAFALLLIPFFTPELLVGYAYSSFSLIPEWLKQLASEDAIYVALVSLKIAPAATLVRLFADPQSATASSLHCHRLLKATADSKSQWYVRHCRLWCQGRLREAILPFMIAFLLVFQEFEVASLLAIPAWTVHLFDAQFQGLQLSATFRRAVFPIVIELLVIVPIVWIVRRQNQAVAQVSGTQRVSRTAARLGLASLITSVVVLTIVPCVTIAQSSFIGLSLFWQNSVMIVSFMKELATAFMMAITAAIGAWLLSNVLTRTSLSESGPMSFPYWRLLAASLASARRQPGQRAQDSAATNDVRATTSVATSGRSFRRAILYGLCLPGLAGSLAISIQILIVIQLPVINGLRSTPLPSLLAMILFLLPRAVLLMTAFGLRRTRQSCDTLAAMAASNPSPQSPPAVANLWWHQFRRSQFWIFVALFYWGFANLTVSSILNPPSIVPLPVRLYNFMHYGQNGPLSVMALLSFVVPLCLLGLAAGLLPRFYRRRFLTGSTKS